ncbi:hypothetical protein ACFWIQ_05170 [Kitasatospora sp. NPDC127059]|uniref:hypothetical protein n=1 Tax=unclassified Kitasatospora TaxID=2633591 RepID=UPI003669FF4F
MNRAAPGSAKLGPGVHGEPLAPLPGLGHRIRGDVGRGIRVRAVRRRVAVGGAAVVLAAAAVLVPAVAVDHARPRSVAAVSLSREGQMVTQPWGTEVPVALVGLDPGHTYRLMTEDSSGRRMPGGSVRAATDATLHTRIMTAMPREAIAVLLVEDESGRVTGRVQVAPPSSATAATV